MKKILANKKVLLGIAVAAVLLVAVVLIVALPDSAHAAGVREFLGNAASWVGDTAKKVVAPLFNIVWFLAKVLFIVIGLVALITTIIASVFDFAVTELVIRMGDYIRGSGAAAAGIQDAWRTIRDIANIGIIAGLVAIAIGTIIRSGEYSVNKTLARLIIAALLVNFSYLFAAAIIDASNFTASKIYTAVVCGQSSESDCSFADRFIGIVRIENIWSGLAPDRPSSIEIGSMPFTVITFGVMWVVFVLTMGFVFIAIIGFLIARFVVLIFLLVTSPIGIAGGTVPLLSNYAKEWWKALFSQAFFAPAFFLVAGLALNIVSALSAFFLQGGSEGSVTRYPIAGTIITFIIAIGFMIAALQIAKMISAEAARFAGLYKRLDTTGIAKWIPAAVLRNTVGRFSYEGGREYTNRIAPLAHKLARYFENKIPGGKIIGAGIRAADLGIKKGFETGKTMKPFGKTSYAEAREAKRLRGSEVSHVEEREKNIREAIKPGGKIDQFNAKEAQRKKELDEREGLHLKEDELNKLARRVYGKDWNDLTDDEKESATSHESWRGRRMVFDQKTGKLTWEGRNQLDERIKNEVGWEQAWNDLKALGHNFTPEDWDEIYDRDPNKFTKLEPLMQSDLYLKIVNDKKYDLLTRNRIRESRLGWIEKTAKEYEAQVIPDEKWRAMSPEEQEMARRKGKVGEFTSEYRDLAGYLFNRIRQEVPQDELQDYLASTPGIASGLIASNLFGDAIPMSHYKATQENLKISSSARQILKRGKRRRYVTAMHIYDDASKVFDERGITNEDERLAMERVALLSDQEFNDLLKETEDEQERDRLQAARERIMSDEGLRSAAQNRAIAAERMDSVFEGKEAEEANTLLKQEHLGHPLIARKIRPKQVAALRKDQSWLDAFSESVFTYGSDYGVEEYIQTNPIGQNISAPTGEREKRVNRRRAAIGRGPMGGEVAPPARDEKATTGKTREEHQRIAGAPTPDEEMPPTEQTADEQTPIGVSEDEPTLNELVSEYSSSSPTGSADAMKRIRNIVRARARGGISAEDATRGAQVIDNTLDAIPEEQLASLDELLEDKDVVKALTPQQIIALLVGGKISNKTKRAIISIIERNQLLRGDREIRDWLASPPGQRVKDQVNRQWQS